MKPTFGYRLFVLLVIMAVGAGMIGGLMLSGSPSRERLRSLDRRRLDQLNQLANGIDTYWNAHAQLPTSLDVLRVDPGYIPVETFQDPVTQLPYEYRIVSSSTYELCATFDLDTRQEEIPFEKSSAIPVSPNVMNGAHPAGHVCWTRPVNEWRQR